MRNHRINSGQSLVEFALIFPLFLLLMMGLFDIGRAIFYFSTLNTAVREGTRFAIVQPDCDYQSDPVNCTGGYLEIYPLNCVDATSNANIAICGKIENKFFNVGTLANSTITIDHTISSTDDPEITIVIDHLFRPITPGISLIGDLNLHVNSHMLLAPIAVP